MKEDRGKDRYKKAKTERGQKKEIYERRRTERWRAHEEKDINKRE